MTIFQFDHLWETDRCPRTKLELDTRCLYCGPGFGLSLVLTEILPPTLAALDNAAGGFLTLSVFAFDFLADVRLAAEKLETSRLGSSVIGADAPGTESSLDVPGTRTGASVPAGNAGEAIGEMRETAETDGIGVSDPAVEDDLDSDTRPDAFESPRRSVPNMPSRSLCSPLAASRALTSAS